MRMFIEPLLWHTLTLNISPYAASLPPCRLMFAFSYHADLLMLPFADVLRFAALMLLMPPLISLSSDIALYITLFMLIILLLY